MDETISHFGREGLEEGWGRGGEELVSSKGIQDSETHRVGESNYQATSTDLLHKPLPWAGSAIRTLR